MADLRGLVELRAPAKAEGVEIGASVSSQLVVMIGRAVLTFAALIALSQTAAAGVPLFGHVSCAVVRVYVAKYTEAAAEKWARGHGASEAEIETARHCLHRNTDVQTASAAPKSQVVTAVTEEEGAQNKPDERDLDQNGLNVPVEGQHANSGQDRHDDKPAVRAIIRLADIEVHSNENVSYETKNEPVPSDGNASTLRRVNVGLHRAYRATRHVSWLQRLWDRLTRRPKFSVALVHLSGSRR